MTLDEYRNKFGWSLGQLARLSNVDVHTVKRALKGETITPTSATRFANAISKELGQTIQYADIDGLNVKQW